MRPSPPPHPTISSTVPRARKKPHRKENNQPRTPNDLGCGLSGLPLRRCEVYRPTEAAVERSGIKRSYLESSSVSSPPVLSADGAVSSPGSAFNRKGRKHCVWMDCSSAEELIGRLNEAQGGFEHAGASTRQDERVNDGANYAGLMSASSYKERRAEMSVKEDAIADRNAKMTAARAKIAADRDAKDKATQEREAREKARKEKLQRDLQDARDDGEDHHASDAGKEGGNDQVAEVRPSKKKKKRALAAALSFDVDGEDS